MKVQRARAIALRQFYLIQGSFARVFPLFAWVAIDIVLWGFITRYLNTVAGTKATSGPAFFTFSILGAVLLWDFMTRVMQGVTMAFFEDVWSRNFLNIFATPLTTGEYLAGLVCSSIITSLIGLTVMLIVATGAFGLSLLTYGLLLVPFVLVLFLFGIALGITGTALVLRMGPAAEWFVWPIPAVVAPFAGVFYPIATMPGWMRAISHAVPASYVFEGMRAIVAGKSVSGGLLTGGVGLAILYLVLACWLFNRVYKHAVRTGLIARYSAETVS